MDYVFAGCFVNVCDDKWEPSEAFMVRLFNVRLGSSERRIQWLFQLVYLCMMLFVGSGLDDYYNDVVFLRLQMFCLCWRGGVRNTN